MRLLQACDKHFHELLWRQAGFRLHICFLSRNGHQEDFRIWDWLEGSLLCLRGPACAVKCAYVWGPTPPSMFKHPEEHYSPNTTGRGRLYLQNISTFKVARWSRVYSGSIMISASASSLSCNKHCWGITSCGKFMSKHLHRTLWLKQILEHDSHPCLCCSTFKLLFRVNIVVSTCNQSHV